MWRKFFLDLVFPQFCLGCGREGSLLCDDCQSLIEILEYNYCPFCREANRLLIPGTCRTHRKMNLDGLFAAVSYKDELVKILIQKFKYQPYLKSLSHCLTSLILTHFLVVKNAGNVVLRSLENSLLIPVPGSRFRKRVRGYSQTEELARGLSQFFRIPLELNCLKKVKKNQPQAGLKAKRREENVKDVFAVTNSQLISGKTVFLVDDVFTTGSTAEECAKILKESGAKNIWAIVAAREPMVE